MLLIYCASCEDGDHSGHIEVIQAAPQGMMGGVGCRCKGECRDFPSPEPLVSLPVTRKGKADG